MFILSWNNLVELLERLFWVSFYIITNKLNQKIDLSDFLIDNVKISTKIDNFIEELCTEADVWKYESIYFNF